ncbi:MAG: LCP family protein [Actinobacteria bacterium]|nr:LCP family protein [Actinomycetota bacterium]
MVEVPPADDAAGQPPTASGGPGRQLPLVTRIGRRVTTTVRRQPLTVLAGAVAAGVLATSGLSYAAVSHFTGAVEHVDVFGPLTDRPEQDQATNILLVGSDDRGGLSEEERLELTLGVEDFGRHTDTMMIIHIAGDGTVDVISLPRDSLVTIPETTLADGTEVESQQAKLNFAYSLGGPTLLVNTIEQSTGVRLDHFVEVDFSGFMNIVDAVGGVDVCTAEPIQDELSGLDIPAGVSTLDGPMALSYVRARYFDPSADLGRMARQQQFLGSMFRKATSMGVLLNPLRLSDTVDAVLASLTADAGLDPNQVKALMRQLQGTTPDQVSFITVPIVEQKTYLPDGGEAVQWNPRAATAIFAGLQQPSSVVEAIRAGIAAIPKVDVAPSEVTVEVLNGSGISGAAASAAAAFSDAGFVVDGVGNGSPTTRTTIVYDPDFAEGLATLTTALPDAQVEEEPGRGEVMSVTVGPDFLGLEPVSAITDAGPTGDGSLAALAPSTSAAETACG